MKTPTLKIPPTNLGFQEVVAAVRADNSHLVGRTAFFSPEPDGRPDYSLEEPPPVPFKARGRLHLMLMVRK